MPDQMINRRLGKYLLQQEIGRGGMARVYRATDTVLQRTVALKILAPQLGNDSEFAQRFEREAITAANLRHPAITTIFDVGEAEGLRYIAMEYIAGRTLGEVLTEHRQLALPLVIAVLTPVAEALQYAHGLGAVHRDVKPQNIMLDGDGRVVLADFGIAIRPSQEAQKLTQAGLFMGTPEYISPEQAQAQPLSGGSDLYSLAIVAYEMLAGRTPFLGATPQLIMAHVYEDAPPITSRSPQLPPELDMVFQRALAKTPDLRFPTVTDFLAALRQVAQRYGLGPASREELAALSKPRESSAGQPTVLMSTPPTGQPLPPADPPITNEIAEVFGPATQQPRSPTPRSVPQPQVPPPSTRDVSRAADEGRRTVQRVYPSTSGAGTTVPPPRARPPRPLPSSGGELNIPWRLLAIVGVTLLLAGLAFAQRGRGTQPFGTPTPPAENNVPALPTETPVVVATETPQVPAVLVPTATLVQTQAPGEPTFTPTLPPTPTELPTNTSIPLDTATTAPTATLEPSATLEPTNSPEPTATPEPPTATIEPPTNTPLPTAEPTADPLPPTTEPLPATPEPGDPPIPGPSPVATVIGGGSRIVAQSGTDLTLFDIVENRGTVVESDANPLGPAAFAPDGEVVLFDAQRDDQRRIYRYTIDDEETERFTRGADDAYHPAWSPNGERVVYVSTVNGNADLFVVDSDGRGNEQQLTDAAADEDYPSFNADGTQLIYESNAGGHYGLYLLDAAGVSPVSDPLQTYDDRYPRFSPDGTSIVFTSNRDRADGGTDIYVQPLLGSTAQRITTFPSGSASGPTWSPDGQFIAFFGDASGNNDIYIVRATGGEPINLTNSPDDERWPVWGK